MRLAVDGTGVELRWLDKSDAEALFQLVVANREHLLPWLAFAKTTRQVEDTMRFLEEVQERHEQGLGMHFGIWMGEELIGTLGAIPDRYGYGSYEIGYWIAKAYEGKGIVTRCVIRLLDHLFEEKQVHRAEIRCHADNARSRAIPDRLGFRLEGCLKQASRTSDREYGDQLIFGLLRTEWAAARAHATASAGSELSG
ncbi:GNAT family N-acetyltransferase [Polycladomyces subterraneus]|uniref:GNAT family N-acetyltransferase n=1 Tax=Polycladomyces subterraneus TaxID=1016997 RepID=A0ABT8IRH6_9BACL|nr:GNAT family protein [Polycladomyces subterraneus]MDN4595416.1 GNAT family N-acetyltransferase [Polycladomyces subterraneus]